MRNTPIFRTYEQGPDFERARTQIATPFQYLDIALDNAITDRQYSISGDFLYIDTAFDGEATIELNNQQNAPVAPFHVQPGFALNALFKSLKISAAAQPGKKIRIMYSTGERVVPALSGTLAVTGTVSTAEEPTVYGASFASEGATLGNTAVAIVAPAANISGLILWEASFLYNDGTYATGSMLAKSSTPASVFDGDVILAPEQRFVDGSNSYVSAKLTKPIEISAGKGLYVISTTGQARFIRRVLYSLL